MNASTERFLHVTEIVGEEISKEQLDRLCHRYYWAGAFCEDRDVLEVACGSGPGLRYLAHRARSLKAGDYSPEVLARIEGEVLRVCDVRAFDAQAMPYEDASLDVVVIFEALYYIPEAGRFIAEASRVLRPNGLLLIANANKDLYDFNPSPHSHVYHGVVELDGLLKSGGFEPSFYGYLRTDQVSWRQRLLRPVKAAAVRFNLIPSTMAGKRILKRLIFGAHVTMPAAIAEDMVPYSPPEPILAHQADRVHKVIYCSAVKC